MIEHAQELVRDLFRIENEIADTAWLLRAANQMRDEIDKDILAKLKAGFPTSI